MSDIIHQTTQLQSDKIDHAILKLVDVIDNITLKLCDVINHVTQLQRNRISHVSLKLGDVIDHVTLKLSDMIDLITEIRDFMQSFLGLLRLMCWLIISNLFRQFIQTSIQISVYLVKILLLYNGEISL